MRLSSSEKAEVELIGSIIILGLTITGIGMITLTGMPAISSLQERANVQDVEQTYSMLDSHVSRVALGEAPRQVIDVNLGGGSLAILPNSTSDPSFILLTLKNQSGPDINIPIPMGKIVYRMGDREIAHEGGGVWSKYPTGSVMISPPEFDYNGVTATFPIVNISGNYSTAGEGTGSLSIEKIGNPVVVYPTAAYPNPLPDNITEINITIKSDYYDAWADYFRSMSLVRVNEVPAEKKVFITLETPPMAINFSYGVLASGEINMKNNALTDSYNSSKGSYSSSKSGNGSIRATEKIVMANNANVSGNALTHGPITGKGTITKNANASSFDPQITVKGTKGGAIDGLSMGDTVNFVQSKMNEYQASNSNNLPSSGGCLRGPGNTTLDGTGWTTCTISDGNYYLTKFDIEGNDILTFDTSHGSVNIALESSDFVLKNSATIIITGDNPVRVYLNQNLDFNNNAIINPSLGNKSVLFQIISSSPEEITFHNNVQFCGFIWAPYAEIGLENNMEIYGAIVGKEFDLQNNQKMHYDEALQNIDTQVTTGTTIMYLYISRNDVRASAD